MRYDELRDTMTRYLQGKIEKREMAAAFALWQRGGARR